VVTSVVKVIFGEVAPMKKEVSSMNKYVWGLSACWMALTLEFFALSPAHAQGIPLYAAAGVKSPVEHILQAFSKETGLQFELHFDTAGAAQVQFLADPRAQVLITAEDRIERSISKGELQNGQMILFGATVAGLASRLSPKPVIKTKEDLKSVLLGARSIAFSDPERGATVGLHFLKVIKALGIESEVLAKSQKAREGLQTMKWVSEGVVDLGVTQVSEIMQADPQSLVGPFPEEFDLSTRYALWLKAPQAPMMKAMVTWLKSKEARELMTSQGLRALE
jgi:molybdate transport system substrate-binding protein